MLWLLICCVLIIAVLGGFSCFWSPRTPRRNYSRKIQAHIDKRKGLSDHQKFKVPSAELDAYIADQLQLLKVWHGVCARKGITYSLSGGAVIGFYCYGTLLPWDDDIDVSVMQGDIVEQMWSNGTESFTRSGWVFNKVEFDKKFYYLGKKVDGWYKLLLSEPDKKDIGGLDINVAVKNHKTGRWYEKPFPKNVVFDMSLLTPITLHGVPTYVPSKRNAYEFLDKRYGTNWRKDVVV